MVWGVHCVLTGDPENQAAMVRKACRIAFDEGFAKAGEGVIIVAGVPLGSPGTTNMVRIAHLDDAGQPRGRGGLTAFCHQHSSCAVIPVLVTGIHRAAGLRRSRMARCRGQVPA